MKTYQLEGPDGAVWFQEASSLEEARRLCKERAVEKLWRDRHPDYTDDEWNNLDWGRLFSDRSYKREYEELVKRVEECSWFPR